MRNCVVILVLILSFACSSNQLEQVALESIPNAGLCYVLKYETESPCKLYLELWETGNSKYYHRYEKSNLGNHHRILVNLLKPKTNYSYKLRAISDQFQLESEIKTFVTEELPNDLPQFKIIKNAFDFNGYILLRKIMEPGYQFLIDNTGEVRWFQKADTALFRPFNITDHQSLISLADANTIIESDWEGDTLLNLFFKDISFHHEIFADNQQIYSLTREKKIVDLRDKGGERYDTIHGDGIAVIDREGRMVWKWNIFDTVDPLQDPDINNTKKDWGHANSLAKDVDGNYLISLRAFDQIWKIDHESGEIIWKLGNNGDFNLLNDDLFLKQHAAHINADGLLMLFDNGDRTRASSRTIGFSIDTKTYLAKNELEVVLPDSLFSFKQGSAFLLNESHVLFSSTINKVILVTNTSGEIVWMASSDNSFYRAIYINSLN